MPFLKQYPEETPNIPFEDGNVSKLKFEVLNTVENPQQIRDLALEFYITYYFPEFYQNMKDPSYGGDMTVYEDLRQTLKLMMSLENLGFPVPAHPITKKYVIISLDPSTAPSEVGNFNLVGPGTTLPSVRNINEIRSLLARNGSLPDFEPNLDYFNLVNNISDVVNAQTEFQLSEIGATTDAMQNLMNNFGQQSQAYNGAINLSGVNFDFLQSGLLKIISTVLADVVEEVQNTTEEPFAPSDGDIMTMYFSHMIDPDATPGVPDPLDPLGIAIPTPAIAGITYFAANGTMTTEFLKVGYLSLIKWHKLFRDPLTLGVLKNYKKLLDKQQQYTGQNQQFPMFEFLSEDIPRQEQQDLATGNMFSFPTNTTQDSQNNALLNEAIRLGLIDVNDTEELEQGIKGLSTEELARLEEAVEKNPELAQKVYEEEKRKRLRTGVDVTRTIARALETGSLAIYEQDSAADRVLRQFGIQALAKEAMICLTFGINFEIGRITKAVGASLKEELNERPAMDVSQFTLFKIRGDIGKKMLNIVLDSISKALLSTIMQLANLLKEACNLNNPRASDYGAVNLADLAGNSANPPGLLPGGALGNLNPGNSPFGYGNDQNSPLGDVSNLTGMTPDELQDYLQDLSSILSSLDICTLILDQQSISQALLFRIIDFNLSYQNPGPSTALADMSSVMEFFRLLSFVTDVTDLCNEIINDISLLNQNNICLTEEDLDTLSPEEQQNIQDLLDLIDFGFATQPEAQPTVFQSDCPDRDNYINDPVMNKLIPETLSDLVEFVEMQFIASAGSIQNALLTQDFVAVDTGEDPMMVDAAAALGYPGPPAQLDFPELSEPSAPDMASIINALESIQNLPTEMVERCLVDQTDLLNPALSTMVEATSVITNILSDPAVTSAITNIANKIGTLATPPPGGPTGMLFTAQRYIFHQGYYNNFKDYITLSSSAAAPNPQFTVGSTDPAASDFERDKFHVNNNFTGFRQRPATGRVASQTIEFSFLSSSATTPQYIRLTYPPYRNLNAATPRLDLSLSGLLPSDSTQPQSQAFATELIQHGSLSTTVTDIPLALNMDVVIDNITANLQQIDQDHPAFLETVAPRMFPLIYATLTDQVFDYYIENGIFNAGLLQSLKFFHDNTNCTPGSGSDLLDTSAIVQHLQDEYVEAACAESGTPGRNRMRNTIKLGMYLLLVQVHIAEFIIKNIFVFSAINFAELFSKEFITLYMSEQINGSMERYFSTISNQDALIEIKNSLIQMFNNKLKRSPIVNQGGIMDVEGNIIFPVGTVFRREGPGTQAFPAVATIKTFEDIISYIVLTRLQSSMGPPDAQGVRQSGPLANAIKNALPVDRSKGMEDIFLTSMPLIKTTQRVRDRLFKESPTGATTTGLTAGEQGLRSDDINTILAEVGDKPKFIILRHIRDAEATPWSTSNYQLQNLSVVYEFCLVLKDSTSIDYGTFAFPIIIRVFALPGRPLLPLIRNAWQEIATARGILLSELSSTEKNLLFDKYVADYGLGAPNNFEMLDVQVDANDDNLVLFVDEIEPSHGPETSAQVYSIEPGPAGLVKAPLQPAEIEWILDRTEYNDFFTNAINKDTINMVPIIDNFYLTNQYFPQIEDAMTTTKDRVLSILDSTIRNEDNYNSTPDLSRSSALAAGLGTISELDPDSMARDFILKMIIKTPIDILKGIIELIDPHVAISKLIKTGTGAAFNAIATALASADLPSPGDFPDDPAAAARAPFNDNADAGDLFVAILCIVNEILQGPIPPPPGFNAQSFFPRISDKGVDFTGTGLGLLMIPPTPLGLIYLLLQLINLDGQTDINIDVGTQFGSGGAEAGQLPGTGTPGSDLTECEPQAVAADGTASE